MPPPPFNYILTLTLRGKELPHNLRKQTAKRGKAAFQTLRRYSTVICLILIICLSIIVLDMSNTINQQNEYTEKIKARVHPSDADKMGYVTPNDDNVISTVREIGGTLGKWDWDVANRLYLWVGENIFNTGDPHIPDPSDYGNTTIRSWWKYPSETIVERRGDCEDLAVLLASMHRAIGGQTYCLIVDENFPHALVITIENQNLSVWDPTMGYHPIMPDNKHYGPCQFMWDNYKEFVKKIWGIEPTPTHVFNEEYIHKFSDEGEFLNWSALQ